MRSLTSGLEITYQDKTIKITPVGAKNVFPEKYDDYGVVYKDAWPNVDLRYELRGENVKEIIVLKSKNAQTHFDFRVSGAKVISHPTKEGYLTAEGMPEEFSFSQLTLDINGQGIMSWPPLTQEVTKDGIRIKLDKEWAKAQPSSSYPMAIDPSFGREATNWQMFKSDGYSCNGSVCYANTGTISNNGWKHWRTYFHFPYNDLAGKRITSANFNGIFKHNAGGTSDGRWIDIGRANCIGYHCLGTWAGSAVVGTDFNINFKEQLQVAIDGGNFGTWWSMRGEEGGYMSFKPYYTVYANVVYDTPTPVATPISPTNKQVVVTTEANTLRVNPVSDADGDGVQYYFRVSTGSDGESGAVINSDWITSSQWTIPDGILQDGTTYYWHVYTRGATQTNPNWTHSFKVDLRTGKDSTQAYDSFGEFSVDLATGNATTSIETHSISALGGSIGAELNYNTTAKISSGLLGEYWNVNSGYSFSSGAPSRTPVLTRNDQDINFDWNTANPGPGVNADWFYARWTGTFTAPNTGTYNFGAAVDDNVAVYVNNSKVYEKSCCNTAIDYTNSSGVSLQAGQTVPIRVEFLEAVGAGYVKLFVKNGVQEQSVPRDWLKTDVQASLAQYGLTGRYYKDNSSHTLPTDGYDSDRFLMSRVDSKMSFSWPDSVAPSPGLPSDFMTRWTGYITVPASGSYTLGANSDDGVRIRLGTGLGGSDQTILDSWGYTANDRWGSSVNLTAGVATRITIDFFDGGGPGSFTLKLQNSGLSNNEIPVKWLSPKANVIPEGWQLGIDVDGGVAYERLRTTSTSVILEDSTRSTHEYSWTGSGYRPPVNENGNLTRNGDNTFTFIDSDGRTYLFSADGQLKSLTSPSDDRSPASLKYEYSGDPSRLTKITDGVSNARFGILYYKSINDDGTCSVSSGFVSAPDGMLCAFKTSDGNVTKFQYKTSSSGVAVLSRVERPGNELTDYGYDAFGRIISTRDVLANDAIIAGVRADDDTVLTEVTYNAAGKVNSITLPAASSGATRASKTFEYRSSEFVKLSRFYNNQDHYTSSRINIPGYWKELDLGSVTTFQKTGTRPVFSCKINWDEFVSLNANCEGQQKLGLLGYFFENAPSGYASQPVYGCQVNGSNEHFLNAVNCGGHQTRVLLGYAITSAVPQGSTKQHQAGLNEPNGFNRYIEYDHLYRTTRDTDATNLTVSREWDKDKDLIYSTTDPTGLMSTSIYDADDRLVEQYGPAPVEMFKADRRPLDIHASLVPKTSMAYDENITGLAVTYFASNAPAHENILGNGQSLSKGQSIWSLDRRLQFTYQSDGNIVLYGNGGAIWSSGTTGVPSTRLTMQGDGNLVLYDTNTPKWSTGGSSGSTSAYLIMQNDGNAVIYRSNGVNWATNTGGWPSAGSANVSLTGTPQQHTTNIVNNGTISKNFGTSHPVAGKTGAWGMRMTGKMKLPTSGNWTFRVQSDNGVRVSIDDKIVLNDWTSGGERSRSFTYNNASANSFHRVSIDYYHALNSNASFTVYATPPGGSETINTAQYFSPDYGLTTSQTVFDSSTSNVTANVVYNNPEYGQINKTVIDAAGLNIEATNGYESTSGGFLRQTSRTSAGGTTTEYQHYSAADTRDNPCTVATESILQAARPKLRIEPDPDGLGTKTSRTSETIYDEAGRVIATRFNSDPWTCVTYDARGRITETVQPNVNGRTGRTTQSIYSYNGNPFVTRAIDSAAGTSETTIDLLGRTVSTKDVWNNEYTLTYDNFGNVTQKTSPLGTEEFLYDALYQIVGYKLNNITYATVTYDEIGRVATVTYPEAKDGVGNTLKLTAVKRDALKRSSGAIYETSDGKVYDETTVLSQVNRVMNVTQQYDGQTINSAFNYDTMGRLTDATIGQTKFEYGYTSPDSLCSANQSNNVLAQKNSNRTTYKVTNLATNTLVTNASFCYNYADQLTYSSDASIGTPTYDDHGNTASFSGNGDLLEFEYDALDQNVVVKQGQKRTEYLKSSTGSILRKKEFDAGNLTASYRYLAGGKVLQTCSLTDDNNCATADKYLSLPGNITLTLSPNNSEDDKKVVYSLANFRGDTALTFNQQGKTAAGATLLAYGAFGEDLLAGTIGSTTRTSINASDSTMGWSADPTRKQDSRYSVKFIQMGSRVYIPSLGRFLQVDPVEGGTLNAYVYSHDPINSEDYSGTFAVALVIPLAIAFLVVATIVYVSNPTVQNAWKGLGASLTGAFNNLGSQNTSQNKSQAQSQSQSQSKGQAQTQTNTKSKPKESEQKKCTNCGIYRFVDTGATNPNNAGKVYIGKTVDFARREAQHGARVTPGSFQVVASMPGASREQIRIREQFEINKQLMLQGVSPFNVKSGVMANRINSMSEKSWLDRGQEALEFGPGL